MTLIRPMRQYEDLEVAMIYKECHPTFPKRPHRWFESHPTLVLELDREIIGYTSYALVMQPEVCQDGEVMIGYGIDIRPGHGGKGYGRRLCDARLQVARDVGAKVFVGHAAPDNEAMIKLFTRDGFKPMKRVPDAYPDGTAMILFMGPIV